jgi:hypothetical protein
MNLIRLAFNVVGFYLLIETNPSIGLGLMLIFLSQNLLKSEREDYFIAFLTYIANRIEKNNANNTSK